MSPSKVLGVLRAGDLIIVRGGGKAPQHVPAGTIPVWRPLARRSKTPKSRLNALIAFQKMGKKK